MTKDQIIHEIVYRLIESPDEDIEGLIESLDETAADDIGRMQQSMGAFKSYASQNPPPRPSSSDIARDREWRASRNSPTQNTSSDQYDPDTEKAMDHLERQGAMAPHQRALVRQQMQQRLKQSGGDWRAANKAVQADNQRLTGDIEREHGQQLNRPQTAPLWQKIRSFYQ